QDEERERHDPGHDSRPVEYPVRVGRIQHPFVGLQDIVDITPHTFSLKLSRDYCFRGPRTKRNQLAPGLRAMYTRLSGPAPSVSASAARLILVGKYAPSWV